MDISLVRHGETDWNRQRRVQGSTDIPLNSVGERQSKDVALRLANRQWDAVLTSPLSRAFGTGSIIAAHLGLPVPQIIEGIAERSYGNLEGLSGEEMRRLYPGGIDSPEGGCEPRHAVADRAIDALSRFAAGHGGSALIVVTHGGVIGSLLRRLTGGQLPLPGQAIMNASEHHFVYDSGRLSVKTAEDIE